MWWSSEDLICSGVPPEVALVMAQAASFLVLNSAFCRMSMSTGKMLASITVCGKGTEEEIKTSPALCFWIYSPAWSLWISGR